LRERRIDEAFRRYHETVNMGAAELERLTTLQAELLESYSRLAKPGGKLVYNGYSAIFVLGQAPPTTTLPAR
jgi:16S rRNA C967 or C1407 C5-methylase (RsmB/RsmF family)